MKDSGLGGTANWARVTPAASGSRAANSRVEGPEQHASRIAQARGLRQRFVTTHSRPIAPRPNAIDASDRATTLAPAAKPACPAHAGGPAPIQPTERPRMSHPQIRISAVSVTPVRIPVRAVHSHGIGDFAASTNVILRLDTDAGIAGWGEAAPWAIFTGSPEASTAALDHYLRPILLGADPFRIEALLAAADRTIVHCTEAKAAMEMALFDIVGKALDTPVCNLLGGRVRDEIPLSFSVANPDFSQDADLIR